MLLTEVHKQALMDAHNRIPQEWTTVIEELRDEHAIENGRYTTQTYPQGWIAGWVFDVTERGLQMIYGTPPTIQGNGKQLVRWAAMLRRYR